MSIRYLKIVFFVGFVAMAVFFWPWAKITHEIPKVWFFDRWVELLAVLAFLALTDMKLGKVNLWLASALAVWTGIAIFASIMGQDVAKSFTGNYYRADGLITFFHLIGLSLWIFLFWQTSWRRLTAKAIVTGASFVSIWIVVDAVRLFVMHQSNVANWSGALGGPFGQPVFLGGYLLVCLPFTLYLARSEKNYRNLYLLSIAIQLTAILLTRSLAAMLGIVLLFLLWWCLTQRKVVYWIICSILGIVSLAAVMVYWWGSVHPTQFIVAESRERIFMKLILAVEKKPVLGFGWANVDYAFDSSVWPIKFNNDVYVDKAHSHLLESLVTTGLVGFVAYLAVLVALGTSLVKRYFTNKSAWNMTLVAVFLLFVFHTQTNVISISEEMLFWMLIGINLKMPGSGAKE